MQMFIAKEKIMKLKELLDDRYNVLNPEEIKTSEDELDNYNKKAEPA